MDTSCNVVRACEVSTPMRDGLNHLSFGPTVIGLLRFITIFDANNLSSCLSRTKVSCCDENDPAPFRSRGPCIWFFCRRYRDEGAGRLAGGKSGARRIEPRCGVTSRRKSPGKGKQALGFRPAAIRLDDPLHKQVLGISECFWRHLKPSPHIMTNRIHTIVVGRSCE